MFRMIALVALLFLGGCEAMSSNFAPKYDPNEYLMMVRISYLADQAVESCPNVNTTRETMAQAADDAKFLIKYSVLKDGNKAVSEIAQELDSLITEFRSRNVMSNFYCTEKLAGISAAAERAAKAIATKERAY